MPAERITAADFYRLHQPSNCVRRVQLAAEGVEAAEPGPFSELIIRLGNRHELQHLATFDTYLDLSEGYRSERERQTIEALKAREPVLYQAALSATVEIDGRSVELAGDPDLLIWDDDGYVVRDCKLAQEPNERAHQEIFLQLDLYGLLLERTTGERPKRLEVFSGRKEVLALPYASGMDALEAASFVIAARRGEVESYTPVGWSKCGQCGFRSNCWDASVKAMDVAIIQDVDQGLARQLHQDGFPDVRSLLSSFDEIGLAGYLRPWGTRMQRVGKKAGKILANARALEAEIEIKIGEIELPDSGNFVMFDLEGIPPGFTDLDQIYLWGVRVYGDRPGAFKAATAGPGRQGDEEGWRQFVFLAGEIFDAYGDVPFVHWANYERTHLRQYLNRYGDTTGNAERVVRNLLDLLPITRNALALPLPSLSLKVIEEYVGFDRTMDEYGGEWAMATFIESVETADSERQAEILDEILRYNEEDLAATWAVYQWLSAKAKAQ